MNSKINMNFSSKNVLISLFFILIATNLVLFYFFHTMNLKMTLYAQIFEFLGSKTFELVTISIGLPILMFLVDYIFKFREKYAEEKKQRKLDSFNLTQTLWHDLAKISTDLLYINNFNDKEKIEELNKNIDKFIINGEDVVNTWFFEFSDLNDIIKKDTTIKNDIQFINLFKMPINILLSGITSVLGYITLHPNDTKKIGELKDYIQIIYIGISGSVHRPTIDILKNAILFSETNEEYLKKDINSKIQILQEFNLKLMSKIYEFYPDSSDNELKEINDYLIEMKNKEYNYEEFKNQIETLYNKLPNDKKVLLKDNYIFSEELIKSLAYTLHTDALCCNFDDFKKQYTTLKKETEKISNPY